MKTRVHLLIFFIFMTGMVSAQTSSTAAKLFLNDRALHLAALAPSVQDTTMAVVRYELPPGAPPKSKGKAFLMSFVLPGLGERYVGEKRRGEYFLATEIGLWLGYFGLTTYRSWVIEDYKTFAASHAHVSLANKSESYFVDIGNYGSIYEYNSAKLRQRNLPDYYYDVEGQFWQWDSDNNRQKFEQLRIDADSAHNLSLFFIGAIIAN
ncbi:hypothetical protein JW935_18165, partial [candidate division KSB1 bacterium]|nr:hypothetical protein [candidate division KSB1 bacterium]